MWFCGEHLRISTIKLPHLCTYIPLAKHVTHYVFLFFSFRYFSSIKQSTYAFLQHICATLWLREAPKFNVNIIRITTTNSSFLWHEYKGRRGQELRWSCVDIGMQSGRAADDLGLLSTCRLERRHLKSWVRSMLPFLFLLFLCLFTMKLLVHYDFLFFFDTHSEAFGDIPFPISTWHGIAFIKHFPQQSMA